MNDVLIVALPAAEELAEALAGRLRCTANPVQVHRFPDGESGVRLPTAVDGKRVVFAAQLERPDEKTLPLLFAADAARELGAAQRILVAPYLPYMRQDERFQPGDAISSRSYAGLLSGAFDALLTVDPHLHRWPSLDAIYTLRSQVVAAAPAIAQWLLREVPRPILVGPDGESAQWVAEVAGRIGAPHVVMTKERHGDREVRVKLPRGATADGCTPVLLDDIVSTGRTLAAASHVLRGAGWGQPLAVAVHCLAGHGDLEALHRAGIARLVSCDTVPHPTNAIGVRGLLADALAALLQA